MAVVVRVYHLAHYGTRNGVLQWRELFGNSMSSGWQAIVLWHDHEKKVAVYEIQVPLAWEPVACT